MKRRFIIPCLIILMVAVTVAGGIYPQNSLVAAEDTQLKEAPKFIISGGTPPTVDGNGTGFVPPPMDMSYLTGQSLGVVAVSEQRLAAGSVAAPPARFYGGIKARLLRLKTRALMARAMLLLPWQIWNRNY